MKLEKAISGLLVMLFFLVLPVAYGQTITTGDVVGTVTDATGAVVPGATMTLKSLDTGAAQTTSTNSSGGYRFTLLKPGDYTLEATTSGLKSDIARVSVQIGQAATVDLVAKVQTAQQVVEVTAIAALVNSENANLSTGYDSKQLENLPAPGNDMTAYALTAPGVTISSGGGYGSFSVFGLPGVSNSHTITRSRTGSMTTVAHLPSLSH